MTEIKVYTEKGEEKVHLSNFLHLRQTEIDFGSTPVRSKTFTVIDSDVLASSLVTPFQSGDAPTGKSQDENEMDFLAIRAASGAGQFTLYADCLTGAVTGKFKVNYLVLKG